ncbi:uncharacterized protein YeaO (DUF488 family) [Dysgonomonas alginatilytica]|uniref:Uncharacterized protein YeaO (DUF488 family) n=1 Tax=Dysgonomonas alginatilytica TaxID=1605892 RepID=A0A2V3PRP0_9BACT|nr:DUF488 family protein [Dysgonomonas alginatilytica]PXV67436.1 uncharacterized protein YeaO (DUF488 family) [Dysgonomonas alginatilytica]
MTSINIKRVYEDFDESDGFRILVDRLWPRGVKKENLHYDLWAKDITPSSSLRKWYHQSIDRNWEAFVIAYQKELANAPDMRTYIDEIELHPIVTLLYAAKDPVHNHAIILKKYLETLLQSKS